MTRVSAPEEPCPGVAEAAPELRRVRLWERYPLRQYMAALQVSLLQRRAPPSADPVNALMFFRALWAVAGRSAREANELWSSVLSDEEKDDLRELFGEWKTSDRRL